MLIAILSATGLFFAGLWAFTAFDNAMLKEERAAWKQRALSAEAGHANAETRRHHAEQDALSAHVEAEESRQKSDRLSSHVRGLMRERSQMQSLQLPMTRVFEIEKSPAQKAATRSAALN